MPGSQIMVDGLTVTEWLEPGVEESGSYSYVVTATSVGHNRISMYTAAVRCYHICISGFFPRFGSGYLTHNCAVAHNFHFCERLDRRPAESIQSKD